MFASIFKAAKNTGYKFELVIHNQPGLSGESVQSQHYFHTKSEAKAQAKVLNCKAYNY